MPGGVWKSVRSVAVGLSVLCLANAWLVAQQGRWTEERANGWYKQQPWLVGANYLPSNAINELEMWQPETFDPAEIDKELGWAESIGMNTMRVFLQNLLWEQDAAGFKKRIYEFLTIAAKHHIQPVFVLFDSCWDPNPKLGPQHPPTPGVHNSGWVQAPGRAILGDPAQWPKLQAYVVGVVGAFGKDPRVLAWDVWNEPDNDNDSSYGKVELKDKNDRVLKLLPQVFAWARSVHPAQPLTSGVWHGDWTSLETMDAMAREQIQDSDVISFHNYDWPEVFDAKVQQLRQFHRPLLCTEYMARGAGSLFDNVLPVAKREDVAAINWGLVAGKSQTYLPWDSWQRPYVTIEPTVWFHDVFHPDGTPYRQGEVVLIRELTGRP
jgi:hypothetical protein